MQIIEQRLFFHPQALAVCDWDKRRACIREMPLPSSTRLHSSDFGLCVPKSQPRGSSYWHMQLTLTPDAEAIKRCESFQTLGLSQPPLEANFFRLSAQENTSPNRKTRNRRWSANNTCNRKNRMPSRVSSPRPMVVSASSSW